jgi:hypothetical protein
MGGDLLCSPFNKAEIAFLIDMGYTFLVAEQKLYDIP